MPLEAFRVLHASRTLLGQPLAAFGVTHAPLREAIETAAETAFERLVDACLRFEVDALLLAGDNVAADEPGLDGWQALSAGVARLGSAGIPVFVVAGTRDPWNAWLEGMEWGPHVHRLGYDAAGPCEIERDGRRLALVCGVDGGLRAASGGTEGGAARDRDAVGIGLASCGPRELDRGDLPGGGDWNGEGSICYWALGGSDERATETRGTTVLHRPGSLQGRTRAEAGSRGASLVSVLETGEVRVEALDLAEVVWRTVRVEVSPAMSRDDLVLAMQLAVEELPRTVCERVRLVTWELTGGGPLARLVLDSAVRQALADELEAVGDTAQPGLATAGWILTGLELFAAGEPHDGLESDVVAALSASNDAETARADEGAYDDSITALLGAGGDRDQAELRRIVGSLDRERIRERAVHAAIRALLPE